jgi:predicted Zn finger-like uncharacterized protein
MTTLEIGCPQCQARFECPSERFGKAVRCGACNHVFTAPTKPVQVAAPKATPVAARLLPPKPAPEPIRRATLRREVEDRPSPRARKAEVEAAPANNNLIYILGGMGGLAVVGLLIFVALILKKGSSSDVVQNTAPTTPVVAISEPAKPPTPAPETAPPAAKPNVTPAPPANTTPAQAVESVKNSTVYIRSKIGNSLAMGSGFFAGDTGYVCTNAHVIGFGPNTITRPDRIEVVVNSGEADQRIYAARMIGVHIEDDLALLWINTADHSKPLPKPLPFGRTTDLVETQEVYIFGFPLGEQLGLNISVNKTTVSSIRKENGSIVIVQVAQGMTNGNSGGPVTNVRGEVIGVSVAVIKNTPLNFAIPSDKASAFVEDQISSGGKFHLGKFTGRYDPRRK